MFGYVTPCKMELKVKDYEKFKAYYCGICKSIKRNFGNLPRFSLNYDMTFLAILLDSLEDDHCSYKKQRCIAHPLKERISIVNNKAIDYAAFCNVALVYYKLLDNISDDHSISSRILSLCLKPYLKKTVSTWQQSMIYMGSKLQELYTMENHPEGKTLDELSHCFSELTGYLLSNYNEESKEKDSLYWLGFNLGKWIYLIDAWDDLEKDMDKNKFNPIATVFNVNSLCYTELYSSLEPRMEFILTTSAQQCLYHLNKLSLKKNKDILFNILQYGVIEKMDTVFKRSECNYEKPI